MNLRDLMNKIDSIAEATTDFANPGTPAPAPAAGADQVDPATAHQYRRAQQAMANLEKAAQYTGTDEIVRQRAGLPPPLPPIEQWDGTMPAPVGRPDWINRLIGQGGGMTGDVEQDQTQAASQNAGDASAVQTALGQLKQLNDLIAKLGGKPAPDTGGTIGQQSAAPVGATDSAANRDSMTFGQAFADARKKGEKTFTWKGKPYNTELAKTKPAQSSASTGQTTPPKFDDKTGFSSNSSSAAFGNPNITRQGKKAGAFGFDEGVDSIANQLVESFGYQIKEGFASDMGQLAAGGVAGHAAGKAAAKMGARFIPGVATGIDAVDAVQRIRDKDYVGAAISGAGAAGGMVPGVGGIISGGAAGINLGRDLSQMNKAETPAPKAVDPKAKQKTTGSKPVVQKETVAESIASLRDRLAMIDEANFAVPFKAASQAVDVVPNVVRRGEKFMGMAQEVPRPALAKPAQSVTDVIPKTPTAGAKTGGNWVKNNPGKSTLGAVAAGAALGYGLSGDGTPADTTTANAGGPSHGPSGASTGDTTAPQFDPEVVNQIGELMSALAQVNDAEIQQGLDQARERYNAITGGKPLSDTSTSK